MNNASVSNAPCVLSLGSLNLDLALRVERLPREDEESVTGRDLLVSGGGRAANVAYLASRIGAASVLLARMGQDDFGAIALRGLQRIGVDLHHVRRIAGEATGVAMIAVRPDGEEAMLYVANANEHWGADDAAEAQAGVAQAQSGSVLVADLEPPSAVVTNVVRSCRERGFRVVLDPSPPGRMTAELYRLCDCITPNREEASKLAGFPVRSAPEALRAARIFRDRGTRTAFVKLQEGGCVRVGPDGAQHIRPPQVNVVDKTGAGDAFAGALAVALLRGAPAADAARLAVAAGAAAVRGYGAQPSYPDRAELESLAALVRAEPLS